MKNRKLFASVICGILAMAVLLSSCSSKSSYHSGREEMNYMVAETAAASAMAPDYLMAEAAMDMEFGAGASQASGVTGDSAAPVSESDLSGTEKTDAPPERKLIRNVDLSLQTTEFDALIQSIESKTAELGGYIEYANSYGGDYYSRGRRNANIIVRLPAVQLDSFLNTALNEATVLSKTESVEDITLRYTDLEARVSALEVERDRLMELLASAENIESIIALESRLSEIRYELESIKSSLRVYDNRVAYSTVEIYISEVSIITQPQRAPFGERLATGFRENWESYVEDTEDMVIGILTNLPRIITGLIFFFIILFVGIRIIKAIIDYLVGIICRIVGREKPEKLTRAERKQKKEEEKRLKKEKKLQKKAGAEPGAEEPDEAASENDNNTQKTSGEPADGVPGGAALPQEGVSPTHEE